MKVYFVPSLGLPFSTYKPFLSRIDLTVNYLNLLEPNPIETLDQYLDRFLHERFDPSRLDGESEPFVIGGHLFGALVALEIASRRKASAVLLISSLKSPSELPETIKRQEALCRILSNDALARLIQSMAKAYFELHENLSAHEASTLADHLKTVSTESLRWSLKVLRDWKTQQNLPQNNREIFQIFGSKDPLAEKICPSEATLIDGERHFFFLNKPHLVADWANKKIRQFSCP